MATVTYGLTESGETYSIARVNQGQKENHTLRLSIKGNKLKAKLNQEKFVPWLEILRAQITQG